MNNLSPIYKSIIVAFMVFNLNATSATDLDVLFEKKDEPVEPHRALLPYIFYNEATEGAVALAFIGSGYGQPQHLMVANAFVGSNGTKNGFFLSKDLQVFSDRLFLDTKLMYSDWKELESYQDGNADFPDERAGSNDSSQNNFVESDGSDAFYRLDFHYLLPMGHGKDKPVHKFALDSQGMLVDGYEAGGASWNPWESGRTSVSLEFFFREQDLETPDGTEVLIKTAGATLGLEYDNRDYSKNPNSGSRQFIEISRDWGVFDDDGNPWTSIELEMSKYFNLKDIFDIEATQSVLALGMWWVDAPTWDSSDIIDGKEVFHRPPLFSGATLGGIDRLRGYKTTRFNDRSAVYYTAEYRHMPAYNIFKDIPLINTLHIPWMQWVYFGEVGRVHDEWDISELHRDMKWNVGVGVRAKMEGVVIRIDLAKGEEDVEAQMFIGHTF